uniref:HAT C-terminal dimerisation domain-containing protein n=1 Tax=Romanomermis culicivorax TaxID=13658 RepID=A0A915IP97_ROMCU
MKFFDEIHQSSSIAELLNTELKLIDGSGVELNNDSRLLAIKQSPKSLSGRTWVLSVSFFITSKSISDPAGTKVIVNSQRKTSLQEAKTGNERSLGERTNDFYKDSNCLLATALDRRFKFKFFDETICCRRKAEKLSIDGDILDFWWCKKNVYPYLSAMTKKYLAAPLTSVPKSFFETSLSLECAALRPRCHAHGMQEMIKD